MATLSDRIKQLRKEKNLTQPELGKIIGMGKTTISMYETGNSTPGDDIKLKMAEYFNVSMDYLMGVSDIRTPIVKNDNKEPKLSPEVETIAAHLEGKDITPKKMKLLKSYIDTLFDDFDDE